MLEVLAITWKVNGVKGVEGGNELEGWKASEGVAGGVQ